MKIKGFDAEPGSRQATVMPESSGKAGRMCSRVLPKPIVIWGRKGKEKWKVRYVIYPNLESFKMACEKCKHLELFSNGKRRKCSLKDEHFLLKYYHQGKSTWVDSVPSALRLKNPVLYQEALAFISKGRARSLRRGVLPIGSPVEQKPFLADGKTSRFSRSKANGERFEDIEESLKLMSF